MKPSEVMDDFGVRWVRARSVNTLIDRIEETGQGEGQGIRLGVRARARGVTLGPYFMLDGGGDEN